MELEIKILEGPLRLSSLETEFGMEGGKVEMLDKGC